MNHLPMRKLIQKTQMIGKVQFLYTGTERFSISAPVILKQAFLRWSCASLKQRGSLKRFGVIKLSSSRQVLQKNLGPSLLCHWQVLIWELINPLARTYSFGLDRFHSRALLRWVRVDFQTCRRLFSRHGTNDRA